MKLALYQGPAIGGDIETGFARIERYLSAAALAGAKMLVFPEVFFTRLQPAGPAQKPRPASGRGLDQTSVRSCETGRLRPDHRLGGGCRRHRLQCRYMLRRHGRTDRPLPQDPALRTDGARQLFLWRCLYGVRSLRPQGRADDLLRRGISPSTAQRWPHKASPWCWCRPPIRKGSSMSRPRSCRRARRKCA